MQSAHMKAQMKLQKVFVFTALAAACLVFFYALGFATDMYTLSFHADSTSKTFYVEGAELFYYIQPFNRILLRDAVILLLLCVGLFATLTHRRRLYYASNYVASALYCAYAAYLAVFNLINVNYIRALYLALDFTRMQEIAEKLNMRFAKSTFMLDCGSVLTCLLIVSVLGLIANAVLKTVCMRRERNAA